MSCWNNLIAVSLETGDIIILNAVTGSQTAVFTGHTAMTTSLAFSLDGVLLGSGSHDMTVKLWDMQTGGIIKTFYGHKYHVVSVSISANSMMIASGDGNGLIYLWNIPAGECHRVIKQKQRVQFVRFSPINPQHLISISDGKVWQWDIDGCQVGPLYDGSCTAFSPDGTQLLICDKNTVTVQNSNSGTTIAEFHVDNSNIELCCFSPNGRFIAAFARGNVYVLDVSHPNPHAMEPFISKIGTTNDIAFTSSSTLLTALRENSVKFWQTGVSSADSTVSELKSTPPTLAPIKSVSLKPIDQLVVSSDGSGVVKTWDISTGICKATFQTPASTKLRDVQLVDGKLISVWHRGDKIHIWDTEKSEPIQIIEVSECQSLRISGDGAKVFCLSDDTNIQAWSIWTGELLAKVELEGDSYGNFFYLNDSKIWVKLVNSLIQGWDFGVPGSSPIALSSTPTKKSHLEFISEPPRIKDTITGKVIFQLFGRHAGPTVAQWDGQYLVAGYETGEVLILDFSHLYPRQESLVYCLCDYDLLSSSSIFDVDDS